MFVSDSGTSEKICHGPPEGPGQQQWQHSESNAAVLSVFGTLLDTLQDRLNMCMMASYSFITMCNHIGGYNG